MTASIRDAFTRKYLIEPLQEMLDVVIKPEREIHYLDACKRMSDTELRETFEWLRDNYEYHKFPSPAEIQKARKASAALRPRKGNDRPREAQPWEERERRRKDLVDAYMKRFECSTLHSQAIAGGWRENLMDYVLEVSRVQAQMIESGPNGVGYNMGAIFGHNFIKGEDWQLNLTRWLQEQSQQASTGEINVTIPSEKISAWQKRVTSMRKTYQNDIPITERLPQPSHISDFLPDIVSAF